MGWEIIQGDCRDLLRGVTVTHAETYHHIEYLDLPDNSIDAIITDGPYGIHFMNKKWDQFGEWRGKAVTGGGATGPAQRAGKYNYDKNTDFQMQMCEIFTEALRVAKPGAHLIAFGGPRTHHRLTCGIEDAGWVIRDVLMWLFGSGFPKSHNVAHAIDKRAGLIGNRGKAIPTASSYQATDTDRENKLKSNPVKKYKPISEKAKDYDGTGTALKPAWEPIILARKPLTGTVADNVIKYGTGILNIDACRIGTDEDTFREKSYAGSEIYAQDKYTKSMGRGGGGHVDGRWPANLILDEESAEMLDAQSGESRSGTENKPRGTGGIWSGITNTPCGPQHGDTGGASRFFYTPKASKAEREGGLDSRDPINVTDGRNIPPDNAYQRGKTKRRNTHPTVKPLDLMRWLVKLVTPPGGTVLDPFCGSGTTIMAARIEGRAGIGIDIDESSAEIARKRVAYAGEVAGDATVEDAEIMNKPTQLGLL